MTVCVCVCVIVCVYGLVCGWSEESEWQGRAPTHTHTHTHTHTERKVCLYLAPIARSVAILKTMPAISERVLPCVCLHQGGPLLQQNKKYGLPDSQFDTKTRLKWPIIILRTYQKDFDMHLTLRLLIAHIVLLPQLLRDAGKLWYQNVSNGQPH